MARGRHPRDIVVIGGSAGSVEALLRLTAALPADFPGSVFIVVHSGPYSVLADLIAAKSALPASRAADRQRVQPGRIYVAPTDAHLVLEHGIVRVTRGPKENGFRPAVDALFRSAARAYGPRVTGVVLSGALDCGAAGMRVIKAAGGVAVVQDPEEALYPDMPRYAISAARPDFILPVDRMPARLTALAGGAGGARAPRASAAAAEEPLGEVVELTCPECHGALSKTAGGVTGFRCHVGHVFSLAGLTSEQARDLEAALWSAVRSLDESEALARRLGESGDRELARRQRGRAETLKHFSSLIQDFLLSPRLAPAPAPERPLARPPEPRKLPTPSRPRAARRRSKR